MKSLGLSACLVLVSSTAFAQPALVENPDFPTVGPGPQAVYSGEGCFLLAQGTILPGDVDWIGVRIPRASSRTIIDVDFPNGTHGSALLAMVTNGTTGFNIGDNNNSRDAFCGLSAATNPVGSPRDSVVDLQETSLNATINIAITGAADTSFSGLHMENFTYAVWVYAVPIPCVNDMSCDDGVACTLDHCDVPTGDCSNTPRNNQCDDGHFCNGTEWCDPAFGCRATPAPSCDDGVDCTQDFCDMITDACGHMADDYFCDNDLFCDGDEWCDAVNGCQPGTPVDCDDGVGCTADACDEETWECLHTASDELCDDGLFCNGAEHCDYDDGCTAGSAPCAGALCRESDDRCVACLSDSDCSDDRFCNGAEHCNAQGVCVSGAYPCGAAMCRESDEQCVECLADTDCSDGAYCNGDEFCTPAGACEQGGLPCGTGLCRESDDRCVHCLSNADCNDGLFCNGMETCNSAGMCAAGVYPCSTSMCRESDDRCVDCLANSDCSDGAFCNGDEFCSAAGHCEQGALPCGSGLCRESDDHCVDCLGNADCEDGVFCNGMETCNAAGACTAGAYPCGGSLCRENDDRCVGCLSNADCNDGLFCNGQETCSASGVCTAGANPCVGSLCRENDDRCVQCVSDNDCSDGLFCNGAEHCLANGMCSAGESPCASGQSCNEATDQCASAGFSMDIMPGTCPASASLPARGYLTVALVGLDVQQVNVNSVRLVRADGAGNAVDSVNGPPAQAPQFRDVAGPSTPCSCPDRGPDGMADLVLSFKTDKVFKSLRLDDLPNGSRVELKITGKLMNGSAFSASDCLTVQTVAGGGASAAQ